MTHVQTLRGAVAADELGATLMHEHVFMLHPEIIENVETDWDEETALVDAARRLDELYAAGIHTIVDLTVIGLGRSVRRLQRVPASSAINIVVATGIYALFDIPSYFKYRKSEVLVDTLLRFSVSLPMTVWGSRMTMSTSSSDHWTSGFMRPPRGAGR